jgi:hypothetical protein
VEAPALGAVYAWTNHVDAPWWDNEDVTLVGAKDKRSTSVGDVVVEALAHSADERGAPVHRRWMVASVGFTAF